MKYEIFRKKDKDVYMKNGMWNSIENEGLLQYDSRQLIIPGLVVRMQVLLQNYQDHQDH